MAGAQPFEPYQGRWQDDYYDALKNIESDPERWFRARAAVSAHPGWNTALPDDLLQQFLAIPGVEARNPGLLARYRATVDRLPHPGRPAGIGGGTGDSTVGGNPGSSSPLGRIQPPAYPGGHADEGDEWDY